MLRMLRLIWLKPLTLLVVIGATTVVGVPTVAALGAFSAAIGQNGTLTAGSIVLRESGSSNTCYSTGASNISFTSNNSSCSTIDTFGAPTGQLPGGSTYTQMLTFTNVGSTNASSFTVATGSCSVSGIGGYYGDDSGPAFCGEVDITIGNSAGTVCYYPSQPTSCPAPSSGYTLTDLNTAGTLTIGDGLAAGASDVLVVSMALDADASDEGMGLQATQGFTWTLNG